MPREHRLVESASDNCPCHSWIHKYQSLSLLRPVAAILVPRQHVFVTNPPLCTVRSSIQESSPFSPSNTGSTGKAWHLGIAGGKADFDSCLASPKKCLKSRAAERAGYGRGGMMCSPLKQQSVSIKKIFFP
ncbi:hypothetical protein WJX84_009350 [Apatococcus fuscideae]|uniref:Uncharacterized protein n=1 Tax=Apatococcus fuscideae TaxID=2026836 RepID=A0AAW1SCS6_9CHLO